MGDEPKKLNQNGKKLLDIFTEPTPPQNIYSKLEQGSLQEIINQLIGSYFLVPQEYDERSLVQQRLARREEELAQGKLINSLQLCISDACNIHCKYCFTDRADEGSKRRLKLKGHKEKLMSLEMAIKGVDTFSRIARENGRKRFIVKFFGREPLMNWKVILPLMDHYGDGSSVGLRFRWDLTTNAMMVTDEIARELKRHDTLVFTSVDSIAEANDLTRVTSSGGKTFDQIDRGIGYLRQHDVKTVFSAVITSTNFDYFDNRIIDYAVDYGVETVIMLLAMQNDFLACQRTHSTEEISNKIAEIYFYAKEKGVSLRGYWHNPLRRLITMKSDEYLSEDPQKEDLASCTATGFQIAMEPSGDLFPCRAQSHHLGHIDDVYGMLNSEAYRHQTMRTYLNVEACRGCNLEGLCQGVCLGHCEYAFDDIYQPDKRYCDIYRTITPKILCHNGNIPEA